MILLLQVCPNSAEYEEVGSVEHDKNLFLPGLSF